MNDYEITTYSELVTAKALRESSIRLYSKGTVLIGIVGQGKTRGTAAIMQIDACINQNMAAIEVKEGNDSEYVHRFLVQAYGYIRNYGKGSNQEALNCESVGAIKLTIPPNDEQHKIVHHIKTVESRIMELIKSICNEIDLLNEYKVILISYATTGKIKI